MDISEREVEAFIDLWAHDFANDVWRGLTADEQIIAARSMMEAVRSSTTRGAVDLDAAADRVERLMIRVYGARRSEETRGQAQRLARAALDTPPTRGAVEPSRWFGRKLDRGDWHDCGDWQSTTDPSVVALWREFGWEVVQAVPTPTRGAA